MGTAASPASAGVERDATAFGGLVPSGAVARTDETLIAIIGFEHFRDGAVAHVVVLTEAPGLIDWDVEGALAVRDDLGGTYEPSVLSKVQGLGQVATTVWLSPAIATGAGRLVFDVGEVVRLSPPRGEEPVRRRAISGAPWRIGLDLIPDRTVTDIPPRPERRQRFPEPASVPSRSFGGFRGVMPVGQARHVEGTAVALVGAELYADRWLLTVAALAPPDAPAAPAIARARISAWDDRENRYRATPIQGATGSGWSEALMEFVPPLPADVGSLAILVEDIPIGDLPPIPGPIVFGVRVTR